MKKAVLFGASGFIGRYLLDGLLNNPDYEQVTIVVRKDLGITNPKLKVLIGDYHSLPGIREGIVANDVFITLGTTKKNTPDQKEYYQIDHDYPVLAAKLAKEKGATAVFLVTAVGADAGSTVFYIRTKGETERDVIALGFDHTHIFRPSMLMGTRQENRPLEKFLLKIWPVVNTLLIGRLKKFRGIDGRSVAKAMLNVAKHPSEKLKVYHWKEMNELL